MKMINMGLFLAIIMAMIVAYFLEADMRARITHMKTLKNTIAYENETIKFLKVEWSFLNSPQRLQNLGEKYLRLKPTDESKIINEKEIITIFPLRDPLRPIYGKINAQTYR